MDFTMIVAMCAKTHGIGYRGTIPWKSKEDMTFFRTTTTTVPNDEFINVVIMGRKTFESLGSRPLKGRINVVCSRTMDGKGLEHVWVVKSLHEALKQITTQYTEKKINKIFVIGGEQLYREGIHHPCCAELLINCMKLPIQEYDTFFPEVDTNLYHISETCETQDIIYMRYSR